MPLATTWSFSTPEEVTFALAGVLVVIVALLGYRAWKNSRITPSERERLRRSMLVARGKMGDATLVDLRDHHVFYAYTVRGVEYTASQDVSALHEQMPSELPLMGAVAVRYDARNPANSIVVAEQWSGLRIGESYKNR